IPKKGPLKRAVHLADYVAGGLGGFIGANPGFEDFREHRLLGERLREREVILPELSTTSAKRVLSEYLARDLRTQFVSEYLTKVDGAAMHYGLEARSPFLDHRLWEFASSLPFATRLRNGRLKAVLREIARRRLGEQIAFAPKRGFTVPVEEWMGSKWHSRVVRSFRDSVLVANQWINAPALQKELEVAATKRRASRRLWYLW